MDRAKLVLASAYSAIVTIVFVVLITIWMEYSAPLKNWLTAFAGHHWTAKSILSVLVYLASMIIVYLSIRTPSGDRLNRAFWFLLLCVVLGTLTVGLFFAAFDLKLI